MQRQTSVTSSLPLHRSLAYGIGHFYNDLCASIWFTYLLVYFEKVLHVSSANAGVILLIGQVTDGLSTPIVGIEADKRHFRTLVLYGQRKSWHLIGTLAVSISFPFIFMSCFGCSDTTADWVKLLYYVPFVVVFQIGWACVQISHLALIPNLANVSSDRTTLNGLRYTFTVIANLTVFCLFWVLLGIDTAHATDITEHDKPQFRNVSIICVGLGLLFSVGFHVGTKEHVGDDDYSVGTTGGYSTKRKWWEWFRDYQFYQIGFIYMCVRLFVNVSQVYLPFYVLESQHFNKEFIAIVPLVVYGSSFATAMLLSTRHLNYFFRRRKIMLFCGALIGCSGCVWMWFHDLHMMVFGVAVLLGISSAILLVTSLAVTADFIGPNAGTTAFVYGAMSFCDKISSGVVIQIVQSMKPFCSDSECPDVLSTFYRNVVVFVPGAALLMAIVALFTVGRNSFSGRWRQRCPELPADADIAPDDMNGPILPIADSEENDQNVCVMPVS